MERILVVDDLRTNAEMVAGLLRNLGYEIEIAGDGEEALEMVRARTPDMVITDIMMPRMDGYEACAKIRSHEETREVPVVFLSARAQQSDIDKGRAYGVSDYLTKPFDPTDLLEVIERLTK